MAGLASNGKGTSTQVVPLTAALEPSPTGGPTTRALLPLSPPSGGARRDAGAATAGSSGGGEQPQFGGSATLIVIGPDGELKEHSTPHEALIVVLQGSAKVKLRVTPEAEPMSFQLHEGDALPVPAGAPHSIKVQGVDEPLKFLLVKTAQRKK